jgi:hypothetical protein
LDSDDLVVNRSSEGQGRKEELEEEGEHVVGLAVILFDKFVVDSEAREEAAVGGKEMRSVAVEKDDFQGNSVSL